MYLLDTNVVSETRRERPHGAVTSWFRSIGAHEQYVASVTVGELQAGIEHTRRQDPERAAELESWLVEDVMATYRILDMNSEAFRAWGRIMDGQSDTLVVDAMIASIASVHDLTVVTRNVRDFRQLGAEVLNPFEFVG